jgi:hypothetical protein
MLCQFTFCGCQENRPGPSCHVLAR